MKNDKSKSIKKLVFVIESMGFGGAERVVSVLTEELAGKYDISVITFKRKKEEYSLHKSIKRSNLELQEGYKKFFLGKKELEKMLLKLKPDIVIAFDILPNILVNAIHSKKRQWGTVISERSAPKEAEISMLSKILRKIYYTRADGYVFQTEEAMKYYSRVIQNRAFIIPNPVKEGLPDRNYSGQTRIVAVGRLIKAKNYGCLINAFALFLQKYNHYTLEIYGEGECRNEIEDCIKKLHLSEHVKLMGNCKDLHEKIRGAQLFVMSSLYEGMPNALMEAMAMGFPVIASDCPAGGSRELIQDGENGYLFYNNDFQDLYRKMCCAVECGCLEKLGKQAAAIKFEFSSKSISARWEKLLEEVGNK